MVVLNAKYGIFFIVMKVLTVYSIAVLTIYVLWALSKLSTSSDDTWYSSELSDDQITLSTFDLNKVIDSFPCAIWGFLAMEVRTLLSLGNSPIVVATQSVVTESL
jgi:hypothetical protein